MSPAYKWRVGDLFYMPQWPTVIYRVHRRHGSQIYYLRSCYGCNPPRGIIHEAHASQAVSWVKVERNYNKPDVAMEVATHTGKRLKVRGTCEKCNTPTNWVVDVLGRVGAYWCGCD